METLKSAATRMGRRTGLERKHLQMGTDLKGSIKMETGMEKVPNTS